MENVFITLLNLSINASYLIIAIILLRFALFKAPKWINCLLWGAVGLRLAFPLKLESILSLIPSPEPIPQEQNSRVVHSKSAKMLFFIFVTVAFVICWL